MGESDAFVLAQDIERELEIKDLDGERESSGVFDFVFLILDSDDEEVGGM